MGKWVKLGGVPDPCGYCTLHRYVLSVSQMKQKNCLGKQCRHFDRRPHPYWEEREKTKEKRRARKARLEEEYQRITKQREDPNV